MSGYAKVFRRIFEGSMRGQPDPILVFVNLLCNTDADGHVDRHWRAVSDDTGLSHARVRGALNFLEAPDPESRTPTEEGRRIVRLSASREWGWRIVNHAYYKELCSRTQNAERQQRFRSNAAVTVDRYGALPPAAAAAAAVVLSSRGLKGGLGGKSDAGGQDAPPVVGPDTRQGHPPCPPIEPDTAGWPDYLIRLHHAGEGRRLDLDTWKLAYHARLDGSGITEEEAAAALTAAARGANWDRIHADKHGEGGWLKWALTDLANARASALRPIPGQPVKRLRARGRD